MPFQKGHKKSPHSGRKKGAGNKVRKNLVEQILDICDKLEEEGKGLTDCAREDPKWFFQNFPKGLLPKNVTMDSTVKIVLQAPTVERKDPSA